MKITRQQLRNLIKESLMHQKAFDQRPPEFKDSTLTSHAVGLMLQSVLKLYTLLPSQIFSSENRAGFKKTDPKLSIPSRVEYFVSRLTGQYAAANAASAGGKLMTIGGKENLARLEGLTALSNFVAVFFKIAQSEDFYLTNNFHDLVKMGEKYDDFLVVSNAHGIGAVHLFFKSIFIKSGFNKGRNVKSFTPAGYIKSFSAINRNPKELSALFDKVIASVLLPLIGLDNDAIGDTSSQVEFNYEQRETGGTTIAEIQEFFKRGFAANDGIDKFNAFYPMIKSLTPDQVAKEIYDNTEGISMILDVNIRFFIELIEDYDSFVNEYRSSIDDQTYQGYTHHTHHLKNAANNAEAIIRHYQGSYESFLRAR